MNAFTVNVIPDEEGGKVPVALAAQTMLGIQKMLADTGEYLVSKELGTQDYIHSDLLDRFVLYMDGTGGMSLSSSVTDPLTEGHGNIADDAVALMDATLTAMTTGIGTYWLEERYTDPFYRNNIIIDLLMLANTVESNPGYTMMFGCGEEKRFADVDTGRLSAYIKGKNMTAKGSVLGVIDDVQSRSKKDVFYLQRGRTRAKISFADRASADAAKELDGCPVTLSGSLVYSADGAVLEIRDAHNVSPADSVKFRRLISCDGDVILKTPVKADIGYSSGTWTLKNSELGISCSKDDWDGAVQAFHDYFIFLWTQYAEKDTADMCDDEREVAEYLNALL